MNLTKTYKTFLPFYNKRSLRLILKITIKRDFKYQFL